MTLQDYMYANPAPDRRWHPTRNTLDPAKLTPGSKRRAWFVCGEGHTWESFIQSVVVNGCGCPYCAGKRAIPGRNDLATVCPEVLQQWDFAKNVGIDPGGILPSVHQKVWWRCELGHSWQARVFSRTRERSSRCPYCTNKLVLTGFNDLATLKPQIAREWYHPLNGELKPEQVTVKSNRKVWWQCGEGHVWQAFIYARTKPNGTGCPICAKTSGRGRRTPHTP